MSRLYKKPEYRRDGREITVPAELEPIRSRPDDSSRELPKKYQELSAIIINLPDDNRPYADVTINGRKIRGLLDSGANITILGNGYEEFVDIQGLPRTKMNTILRTADGAQHVINEYVKIPFEFNGKRRIITTLVSPSIKKPLILGTDFWNSFRIRPTICEEIEVFDEKECMVTEPHTLNEEQQQQLNNVIKKFKFSSKSGKLNHTTLVQHEIDTENAPPVKQKQYVVSPYVQKEIDAEIDRMLERDIIEKVKNPTWLNPIVAVKKASGKIRICLDARRLNDVTKKGTYPQQNANRILGQLRGTKYLTAIDMTEAFHQILLHQNSRLKTAFAISGKGAFMYKRMAMGLCNSGRTLCELIDNLLGSELEPEAFPYLDDFIIATDTFERHLEILEKVAKLLAEANLTISEEKSRFCMKKLRYLGYELDEEGLHSDPERIKPVLEYPSPKSVREVRRLMGMAGWYRRFIKDYATITAPITETIKGKNRKFTWTDEASQAFESLKQALISAPVLATPDYSQPFIIQADASDIGLGAVLTQGHGDDERVIAYLSQKLTATQRKYHVTEKECLAVITAVEKFRPYIEGVRFTVVSDHASLLWLRNLKDPAGRLARWALRLQAYDFDLIHRKGKHMVVPDALSRAIDMLEIDRLEDTTDQEFLETKRKVENDHEKNGTYLIKSNILYKKVKSRKRNASSWRVLVPKDLRKSVLRECHDSLIAAHGGYMKTLNRIKRLYVWENMNKEIERYVKNCDVCKATKSSTQCQRTEMGRFREAKYPWRSISLDFMGPFPLSKEGHRFLLVVIDNFSKYVLLKPLRTASSKETVKFLTNHVIYQFGTPEKIILDNGTQLKSSEFSNFLDKFKISGHYTPKYHPQANPTEAANKTILNAIKAYIKSNETHRQWDHELEKIQCAINSSCHTSTKETPYFINYGRELINYGNEHDIIDPENEKSATNSFEFQEIRKNVSENLKNTYEKSKRTYDLRSRTIEYVPGQIVWKKNTTLSDAGKRYSAKLAPRYVKCRIRKKLGSNTYEIEDLRGNLMGRFSTISLKPHTD